MGYDVRCLVSRLSIQEGDDAVFLPLIPHREQKLPRGGPGRTSYLKPGRTPATRFYAPLLPVRGTYDGDGNLSDARASPAMTRFFGVDAGTIVTLVNDDGSSADPDGEMGRRFMLPEVREFLTHQSWPKVITPEFLETCGMVHRPGWDQGSTLCYAHPDAPELRVLVWPAPGYKTRAELFEPYFGQWEHLVSMDDESGESPPMPPRILLDALHRAGVYIGYGDVRMRRARILHRNLAGAWVLGSVWESMARRSTGADPCDPVDCPRLGGVHNFGMNDAGGWNPADDIYRPAIMDVPDLLGVLGELYRFACRSEDIGVVLMPYQFGPRYGDPLDEFLASELAYRVAAERIVSEAWRYRDDLFLRLLSEDGPLPVRLISRIGHMALVICERSGEHFFLDESLGEAPADGPIGMVFCVQIEENIMRYC